MNRSLLVTLAFVAALSFHAAAENQSVVNPTPSASEAESPELKRFNLDFPGGTPVALVAAISKAMGKHLNVIIPASHADTKIMAFKVEGVTVPQLFSAIQAASRRDMPRLTGPASGQRDIVFKTVEVNFGIAGGGTLSNDTVWSFTSTEPTAEDETILSANNKSEQVGQYFQLASYLEDHTIEDITTAIQTGWKMLNADPMPQLSFHKETKLLIAVGQEKYVSQIPQVLEQMRLDFKTRNGDETAARYAYLRAQITEIRNKRAAGWEQKVEVRKQVMNMEVEVERLWQKIQDEPNLPLPPAAPAAKQ